MLCLPLHRYALCKYGHRWPCRQGHDRFRDSIDRSSIKLHNVKRNTGGALNNQGNFSARRLLAGALAAMGAVDGNVPREWVPTNDEATRAPNKGKRSSRGGRL